MKEFFKTASFNFISTKPHITVAITRDSQKLNPTIESKSECVTYRFALEELNFESLSTTCGLISTYIKNLDCPLCLEIDENLNIGLILESLILALTDINFYTLDYTKPTSFPIFTNEYIINAYSSAFSKAQGYHLARVLNHLPFQVCNAQTLSDNIDNLLNDSNFKCTVYRKDDCERLNMQGVLAVAQAAKYEPAVIKIEYIKNQGPKIGLIGKGMMFDSGGYNLKTGDYTSMKTDMAGCGAVLGTLKTISLLDIDVNITAYLMCTDNLIGSDAYTPGQIIEYSNGVSVEVGNTDAEGRLVLADGLLQIDKDDCDLVIDIATLTGNSAAALGKGFAPLYSTNPDITNLFTSLNYSSTDNVWPMPIPAEYKKFIKGNISDIRNTANIKHAGSIMAAVFLSYFAPSTDWVHIDMGAMSRKEEFNSPVNGYGVRLLTNFIQLYIR